MARLAKKAAEVYLVIVVLVTSLLADNDPSTLSQNDLDISEISSGTEITPEGVAAVGTSLASGAAAGVVEAAAVAAAAETNGGRMPRAETESIAAYTIAPPPPLPLQRTAIPPTADHGGGGGGGSASSAGGARHANRLYPLPHFRLSDLPDTRWGPFFEEGNEDHNVTARIGSTVNFDCRIGLLQNKTVTWLHHKEDSIHLLTVGRQQYSSDARIALNFRYPNNYRLKIAYVTRREEGLYECQVATHPPKVKRIFLKVIAPQVQITDESGRQVTERYYKAGSGLELACNARQVGATADELPVSWRHDDQLLTRGISSNVSTSTDSASATLTIAPLQKKHSGNYTCAVGSLAAAAVAVHVLNGELPAAVHHGNAAGTGDTSLQLILAAACITVWRLR